MPKRVTARDRVRSLVVVVREDGGHAVSNDRSRLAAAAALVLALDGAVLGWALGNLSGMVAWVTLGVSALGLTTATVAVAIAAARLDRRLARIRHVRRVFDLFG